MLEIIKVITVLLMAVPFVYMLVDVTLEILRTSGTLLSKGLKPVYIRIKHDSHR